MANGAASAPASLWIGHAQRRLILDTKLRQSSHSGPKQSVVPMCTTMSRAPLLLCLVAGVAMVAHGASAQSPTPSASPAATPTAAAKPKPALETPALVVDGTAGETLLGKPVQTAKGEDLGRVVDVIVDRTGLVRAAIIDFGGFLGVGSRTIAVDWHVLHFPEKDGMDKLIADLSRDQLRTAPVFKSGEPVVIMGGAKPSAAASPAPAAVAPAATDPPATKP